MRLLIFTCTLVCVSFLAHGEPIEYGAAGQYGSAAAFLKLPYDEQEETIRKFVDKAPLATAYHLNRGNADVASLRSCAEAYIKTPSYADRMDNLSAVLQVCLQQYNRPVQ